DEGRAEDEQAVRELAIRGSEGVREPEEQIREEDEQGDDDADVRLFQEVAVVGGDETEQLEEAERPERDRRPASRPVTAPQPEKDRDSPQRHIGEEVDVAKNLDRVMQGRSPEREYRRTVCVTEVGVDG